MAGRVGRGARPHMARLGALALGAASVVVTVTVAPSAAQVPPAPDAGPAPEQQPGTAPAAPSSRSAGPSALAADSAAAAADNDPGLHVIVDERGRISQSVDAVGSTSSDSQLDLVKPAGATLRRAAFFVASTGFTGPAQGAVLLDGAAVDLGEGVPSHIGSQNYWVDVTARLRPKVDAAAAGPLAFAVTEEQSWSIDGVALALVFDDPAQVADRSITLLFGAHRTAGDEFTLNMSRPVQPAEPGTVLEMSLGISYGFQTGEVEQYSRVRVNGAYLTSSAGGEDDGESFNGALITVGGVGDISENPPDPQAPPLMPRSDDELYDLRPFVPGGSTRIEVTTENPSNDDNIFFAAFTTNPPVTDVETGPNDGLRWMALGDSYSAGVGGRTHPVDGHCRTIPSVSYAGQAVQLAEAAGHEVEFRMNACMGAVASDVWSGPQDGTDERQIEAVREFRPDVVTLTIGGNDIGFGDLVTRCASSVVVPALGCPANPDRVELQDRAPNGERAGWDGLYDRLVTTYSAIRNVQGPDGHLYVLSYPTAFPKFGRWSPYYAAHPSGCFGFKNGPSIEANALSTRLGDTIFLAVAEVDRRLGNVHFVDWRQPVVTERRRTGLFGSTQVRLAYNDDGVCGRHQPWDLNGLVAPNSAGASKNDSFHPTSQGYREAAQLVWASVQANSL